jgi:hypothetical protein
MQEVTTNSLFYLSSHSHPIFIQSRVFTRQTSWSGEHGKLRHQSSHFNDHHIFVILFSCIHVAKSYRSVLLCVYLLFETWIMLAFLRCKRERSRRY